MFSTRFSIDIRRTAAAGVAALALVAACGEDGGGGGPGKDVEFQVIGGLAFTPETGYFVHVKTPRTNAFDILPSGDQTNSDNWTKLELNLLTGDQLRISVLDAAGDTLMTDQCVVDLEEAPEGDYARTIVFWFAPPNNYADCADNLVDPVD